MTGPNGMASYLKLMTLSDKSSDLFMVLGMCTALFLIGGGAWSVDRYLCRRAEASVRSPNVVLE